MPELDIKNLKIPQHIAIVMDGNGRWAKKQGKARVFGHERGVESARTMVECAAKWGVKSLTLFAFSSENWQRPEQEVGFLMKLFIKALDVEAKKLHKNSVRLKIIGDVSRFEPKLQQTIQKSEQLTEHNTGLQLNIAANYGGRWDIVEAARQFIKQSDNHKLDNFDEKTFSQYTLLSSQADVDLFIRTGGEKRISNFLLWQIAYAELYFSDTLWPDFGEKQLYQAIEDFSARERRFGKIKS